MEKTIIRTTPMLFWTCIALGGCASAAPSGAQAPRAASSPGEGPQGAPGAPEAASVTVRYQVKDLERAVRFYTEHLGFREVMRAGSAFGAVSRGPLRLILSGPGSSGSRPMPDGRRQEPGGWNRIVLYVDDLGAWTRALGNGAATFRNTVEVGPGGKQILIEDPDGNPIELHEAPRADDEARSGR
jgi:catechol 2,3-dioxygenase-like lactoylglutathione lyase family enzyme